MRLARLFLPLALAVWIVSGHTALAEGWSLGKLWPFGSKGIHPVKAVKKVGGGTKRFATKTKQSLSFNREEPKPSQFAAWQKPQEYRRTGDEDEKPGLFSSWFQPADPPRPSKTIKDFMSQKRVEP